MFKVVNNQKRFKLLTLFGIVNVFILIKVLNLVNTKYSKTNVINETIDIKSLYIEIDEKYQAFSRNDQALKRCLSILYENDAFLIRNEFFKISKNQKILAGIFEENLNEFNQKLVQNFNKTCNLTFVNKTQSSDFNLLTGIYVNCASFSVQMSVFYRRNHFLWTGFAGKDFKFFGDSDRAFN